MIAKCEECDGQVPIPEDVIVGEIVTCPDCGLDYEVASIENNGVKLQRAEVVGEDWGE